MGWIARMIRGRNLNSFANQEEQPTLEVWHSGVENRAMLPPTPTVCEKCENAKVSAWLYCPGAGTGRYTELNHCNHDMVGEHMYAMCTVCNYPRVAIALCADAATSRNANLYDMPIGEDESHSVGADLTVVVSSNGNGTVPSRAVR